MTDYDIIVVGAGPIGSTYAYKMAKKGYNVAMYDMKNRIGQPLQCAGLVSTNIDKTRNLPDEFIDNKLKGANLISPDKTQIQVSKDETSAYVIDRVLYDKYLVNRAEDAGVDMYYATRVVDVDINNTMIKTEHDTYSSDIICVSCGPNSSTSKKMNPNIIDESFLAMQYIIKTQNTNTNYLNLHIDTNTLPGFIWRIPVSPFESRLGLFTTGSYQHAAKILNQYLETKDTIAEKVYGLIPKFNPKKKIVKNNTFLIGDAASQVKPTTGGGLIAGFNITDIAVENTDLMLKNQDNNYLKKYETDYHTLYDNEFKTQQNVQKIMKDLTEDDFNYMFKILRQYNVDEIISQYGDMDNQTQLLKQLIKSGIIFKLVPKIGIRRLKNIWKSQ